MKKIVFLLLSFNLLFGFELQTDKALKTGILKNGFKYYIYKNSMPKNNADFYLFIKAGSTNETDKEQGLAHFVEHMVFNGSEDFNKNSLITTLEGLGVKFGPDLNAATSFDETFYELHIKTDDKALNSAFKVFENMAGKVLFKKDDLDAERGVIIEEDRQRNNSSKRIFDQQMPYIFGDSVYSKRLPIGKMDIIKSATPEDMKGFYHKNYQPKNMSFIAVGDFDVKKIEKLIQKSFSYLKDGKPNLDVNRSIPFFNKLVAFNAYDSELSSNSVDVYYEAKYNGAINNYENFKDDIKETYIKKLISIIENRKINLSKKALTEISFLSQNIQNQKLLNGFDKSVTNEDFNASIKDIFSLIKGIKEFGFNKDDFDSAKKDFVKVNQSFYDSRQTRRNSYYSEQLFDYLETNSTFLSEDDRYNLTKKALDEITLDDINKKFKEIVDAKGLIVEILSQKKVDITSKDVQKLIDEAKPYDTQNVKSLPDSLFDDSNLTIINPVIQKNLDNNISYFEYSNGAKVYYKNLTTKKDTVLFSAIRKGGLTNIDDMVNAKFAVSISNESGILNFNDYEAKKILAGHQLSISRYIDKLSLGYEGSSTTNDFKTLLKTFYAIFEKPKISQETAQRFKTIGLDTLKTNEDTPRFKFNKEFLEFYFNKNERAKVIGEKDFNDMNISKMQEFLDKNFTNAGDFNYFIVGDISQDEVVKMVGKYIANLKGSPKEYKIKDDGVRGINGEHIFARDYLEENKAEVGIIIKNEDVKYSLQQSRILSATNEVLNVLMREKIREKDSNVYGIYAASVLSKYPFEHSVTNIEFSSAPKNAPQIVQNVKDIIKYMQSNLVDEKYLQNYKKSKKISLKKSYEMPSFWLSCMKGYYLYEMPILSYDEVVSQIDKISLEDIKKAANDYLKTNNFVVSVLVKKGIKEEINLDNNSTK